ncbi:MAG: NADH:flavin oxidoreductase/NADH oxidase family protein [Pseudomonadota bacterium]
MTSSAPLFEPLQLPNGAIIPNRLCKAAMEENLSEEGQLPGERLFTLYKRWAEGGAGLILTGNVMISPAALTGPGGVVLEAGTPLERFEKWAAAGRSHGAQFWMQINHPGRQVYADMKEEAVSASAVGVNIPGFSKLFPTPRALTGSEVEAIIERFATTAALAEKSGFTGVQIHAAHGYLISQFLSPLTNQRDDEWGGSLENRARFLLRTVEAVRAKVAPSFCVSVKLNSADFQKGGFDQNDAKWVVGKLNTMGVDLVELSGGSYESPAMQGRTDESSTSKREAYFIDFARDIATVANMPVMVTGGIRKLQTAVDALTVDEAGTGVSILGIARALAFEPDLPNNWKAGRKTEVQVPEVTWKSKPLAGLATMALAKAQLERMADGKPAKPDISPVMALIAERWRTRKRTKRYRRWRDAA